MNPFTVYLTCSDTLKSFCIQPLTGKQQGLLECGGSTPLSLQAWPLRPALLITKLHPQKMPGPYLASRLRERSPQVSVMYSSANPLEVPDPKEVVSSMLPRPFSKETLPRRIKTLLACQT